MSVLLHHHVTPPGGIRYHFIFLEGVPRKMGALFINGMISFRSQQIHLSFQVSAGAVFVTFPKRCCMIEEVLIQKML